VGGFRRARPSLTVAALLFGPAKLRSLNSNRAEAARERLQAVEGAVPSSFGDPFGELHFGSRNVRRREEECIVLD
jgi:hypothetical protein